MVGRAVLVVGGAGYIGSHVALELVAGGRKVVVLMPKRGDRVRLVEHATDNAREALGRRMAETPGSAFSPNQARARPRISGDRPATSVPVAATCLFRRNAAM